MRKSGLLVVVPGLASTANALLPSLGNPLDWIADIIGGTQARGETIERDVCVIGGGASGMHAAVSLKDLGKTVAVIEKADRLGGNTQTYTDPETQTAVDYGVVIHQPLEEVFNFFAKFEIPLLNMSSAPWNEVGEPANPDLPSVGYVSARQDVDFRTGVPVEKPAVDPSASLARLAEILAQWPFLQNGFGLPDPVPEELYMPYGEFLEQNGLTDVIPIIYQFSQGMGDLLHISTLYAVKYFNLGDLTTLSSGYMTAATGDTSNLYVKAGEYLGGEENVFMKTEVKKANRDGSTTASGRPELLISSGPGPKNEKLLSCGQIVYTAQPTLSNLKGWDLSESERSLFKRFNMANGYWTGLVTNVGLNQSETYWNSAPAEESPYLTPILPGLYAVTPTGVVDDVWAVKFGANSEDLPGLKHEKKVQDIIREQIATLQEAFGVTEATAKKGKGKGKGKKDGEIEFLAFASHTPFQLQVSAEEIRDGFYGELEALQGGFEGTMFYGGATFHTHYTALLWRFNREVLLPMMG